MPAGQTSAQVTIPTVTDNSVEADRVLDGVAGSSPAYQTGSPSERVGHHHVVGAPDAQHHDQHPHGGPGGLGHLHDHRRPGAGEGHVGQLHRRRHGPARPGLRAPRRHGAAEGGPDIGDGGPAVHREGRRVRADGHDRGGVADPGRADLREGGRHRGSRLAHPVADPAHFTVTLQASASDRTKLQVGQHCTVQLVGGTNQVSGTISELDADQTLLSSGAGNTGAEPERRRGHRSSRCTRARSRCPIWVRPTARP